MSKKVLVIDDEPELREVLRDLLEMFGLEVELACDGQEAIDKIKVNKFDLVISDQKMPRKSGLDVLIWLRECQLQTPFLMQTGHSHAQLREEAQKYQVLAVLDKPWDQQILIKHVREALKL